MYTPLTGLPCSGFNKRHGIARPESREGIEKDLAESRKVGAGNEVSPLRRISWWTQYLQGQVAPHKLLEPDIWLLQPGVGCVKLWRRVWRLQGKYDTSYHAGPFCTIAIKALFKSSKGLGIMSSRNFATSIVRSLSRDITYASQRKAKYKWFWKAFDNNARMEIPPQKREDCGDDSNFNVIACSTFY